MSNNAGNAPPIDVREIFRVILRRKWLLVIPWAAAVAAGLAGAFLLKPIYVSEVKLLLERPATLTGRLSEAVGSQRNSDAQADVMREQAKSSLFLSNVITATNLLNDPRTRAWALKNARRQPGMSEDEVVERFLIEFLRTGVMIKRSRGDVFQITVEDYDRHRARLLAEGIANHFVASSKERELEAVQRTHEFSLEQQKLYKRQLEESEAKLEAFRRNLLTMNVVGSSVGLANIGRAKSLLDQAQFEAEDLRQRVATLRGQLAGTTRENDAKQLDSPQVNSLAASIATLERQLASAQVGETATGPADNLGSFRLGIVRKHAELEVELGVNAARALPMLPQSARDALVAYRLAQADLAGVEARRQWLAAQVASYERSVVMTPNTDAELQRLTQQVESDRQLYVSFLNQSSSAQIAEAFQQASVSGRFDFIEHASLPLSPSKPNRPILIMLALLAGCVIGVGTVLLVEHHDQSVKNADEVESLLGLPVIGMVPRVPELDRSRHRRRPQPAGAVPGAAGRDHGLLHRLKVESPLGLEFRRSYLKLAKTRGRQLPRSLVVTSATRAEGKTTTTACLAITLARELRQKVLLVDFDLRSPAMHRALGLPSSSWGLAQMLHQRHFDERFVRATVLPHLEFLPAGKSERPASELIDTEAVEWFVKEATGRYPMVIIDSAPNLAVPDSLILGRAVEGVLYVIKAGSTVRKAAEYGVRVQREARDNVLGVLINDSGEVLPHYYGYRYNYYGYSDEAAGADT